MADQKPDLKVQSFAQMRNGAIAEIRNGNADAADLVSRYGLSKSDVAAPHERARTPASDCRERMPCL
jgi:hypothetical protein